MTSRRTFDRRQFTRAAGLSALAATVPVFLHKTGAALAADPEPAGDRRVLVIVQLAGGNDGLNTVVPHADDAYYRSRPTIAVPARDALRLDDRLGLHPEMVELHEAFRDGGLAVVTNVGYPNPNRSHFRSMDVWETASPADRTWATGWVGRYFDRECRGEAGTLGVRLGQQAALTFAGRANRAATLENPAMLEVPAAGAAARALERLHGVEPTRVGALDFIQRTGSESRELTRRIRAAAREARPAVDYPPFLLCRSLQLVAQMIAAGVPARVYYVTHGGFDTHSAQANRHAALLQELSQALGLFRRDLRARGLQDRVLTMTFSEFGRRIDENRQHGTDHGTANVMFLMGGGVAPGVHGSPPDLGDRDGQGDLVFRTDFRRVYAGVLRDWLGADPAAILGGDFEPVALFRS